MSTPDLRGESQRWLAAARQDLVDARLLTSRAAPSYRNACFLAQQCAEKGLKAVLIWSGLEVPFRHDLEFLVTLIPNGWNLPGVDWPALTQWATAGRYPGHMQEPDRHQATAIVEQANGVLEAIEAQIRRRLTGG